MRFLSLATRSVLRQRRRTLLTFAAVAVSTVVLAWLWAFMDGQSASMIATNTGCVFQAIVAGHFRRT